MFRSVIRLVGRTAGRNNVVAKHARSTSIVSQRLLSSGSSSASVGSREHDPANPLPYKKLPFDSAELDVDNMPVEDTAEFGTRLWSTIDMLRAKGTTSIFLKVPMLFAHFIPIAGLYGFKFHHAEGDVATMLMWLPHNVECKVPPFATHHLGVGGVVLVPSDNPADAGASKILVVKEKSKIGGWKLPGGYANLGEGFGEAAVREVFEETGIRSIFHEVLTVRHSHNIQFGRSDLYVICRLTLDQKDLAIKVDSEIEDAAWVTLKDFRADTLHPMLQTVADMLIAQKTGYKESTMPSLVPGRKTFKLYHP